MEVNWRMVLSIILFAMLIVAFIFAIWAYVNTTKVKTNVPSVINDNNTYINNIASAPNLVTYFLDGSSTYVPKSTDNGSTILVKGFGSGLIANFDIGKGGVKDSKNSKIPGYYFKVFNGNLIGGANIDIYSNSYNGTMGLVCTLQPGQTVYYFQLASDLGDPNILTTEWSYNSL